METCVITHENKEENTPQDADAEVKSQSKWKQCLRDAQYPRETPRPGRKNPTPKNTDLAEFTHRRTKYVCEKKVMIEIV